MFESLAEAVEELQIPLDSAALRSVLALGDRLEAKVSGALGDFDAAELWDEEGATSLTAWLRSAGHTARDASLRARTARRLHELTATRVAWEQGGLSGGQVRAVLANLPGRHADRWRDQEAELLPALEGLDVADTATAMQHWRRLADALDPGPEPDEPANSLHCSPTLDGRRELSGSFEAEPGAVIEAALGLAEVRDLDGERRSPSERRADALFDICRQFLDHQSEHRGGRHRPHLNVVVDLERRSGALADGTPLDPATVAKLLCDCSLHRVLRGGSSILDYGRATRTAPVNLFNALVVRDTHCRFPGCDRSPRWCEAHHVLPWDDGGNTTLTNLVLLCARHHHKVHREGWTLELLPDASLEVTLTSGRVKRSAPPTASMAALAA